MSGRGSLAMVLAALSALHLPGTIRAQDRVRLLWESVRVEPGQPARLRVEPKPVAPVTVTVTHPLGVELHRLRTGDAGRAEIPGIPFEGGLSVEVRDAEGGFVGHTVLSVCAAPEHDIRYGFATNFGRPWTDGEWRASLLAEAQVNAIEFYDFFAAHGDYTPETRRYKFEPFGVAINADNVRGKQEAFRALGIQSYAYVAPYSAAQSVFDRIPDPVLGDDGAQLVYGPDHVKSTKEYDRAGKSDGKWFTIMAMDRGSRWRGHVLAEYRNLLAGRETVLAPFDGMEVDTYGIEERPYRAEGWPHPGVTIGAMVKDIMEEVRVAADEAEPRALLTSNCVNGRGMEDMAPFVDWQFMEIWPWGTETLGGYASLMEKAGRLRGQRVVAKSYPDKMVPPHDAWPAENLRLMMGTAMLTGGSFMVAGEPDPATGRMHGLKTDYYGNNTPMDDESWAVLCAYNNFDALLYRITHGANVVRADRAVRAPGMMTRSFHAGERGVAITLLRAEEERKWTAPADPPRPLEPTKLRVGWNGDPPSRVRFGSPDAPEWEGFVEADWSHQGGQLVVNLPPFTRFACVLMQR